jgi:hypothetical protein
MNPSMQESGEQTEELNELLGGWEAVRDPDGSLRLSRAASFRREEWHIGPDLLELRETLFGFKREWRFQAAALEITASGGGGSGEFVLSVVDRGKKHRLEGSRFEDEIRRFGLFLAEETGWPLNTRH